MATVPQQLVATLERAVILHDAHDALPGDAYSSDGQAARDARSEPLGEYAGTLASSAWAAGIDHLLAWYHLIVGARVLPIWTHATLARGALEGAVTCRYLLDPAIDDAERRRRGALEQLADLQRRREFEDSTLTTHAMRKPGSESGAVRYAELLKQIEQEGIVAERPLSMTSRFGNYLTGVRGDGRWVYHLLSGQAHGRQWAMLAADRSVIDAPALTGQRIVRTTANMRLVLLAALIAAGTLELGLAELKGYVGESPQ